MPGKMILTNSDHFQFRDNIFPSLPMPTCARLHTSDAFISNFYGFGVAITPSSCHELSLMEKDERKKLLEHMYSKEGLGLSVGRICIGSCDYSPEIYSYDDVAFDTELTHFSIARDENYIIPMLKEILEINPELYLSASPWSPPYWMKTGSSVGGGYMREKYLECYGDYIIKFIQAYASHGIRVRALTAQNEPNTQKENNAPTCIWHPETEAKFLAILHRKLKENNLNVNLWLYDHNFDDTNRVLWSLENCEGLKENCDGVAFHYYCGSIEQTIALKKKYPALELHFTEGGPRLSQNYEFDYCKWALMIIKAIKVGYQSFTGWNLILNEFGGPNVGPHIGVCGGLVTLDSRTKELGYSGQYKVFSHIVPYISPASKLYYIFSDETFNHWIAKYPERNEKIEGVLVDNSDGKKIAFLLNQNDHGVQAQIEIDGTLWYVELEANSIATLEIDASL